ncbi:TNT domain-containing protein [Kineosporia sp. NBRC 101731]|uniref:TNT domain-containing protein n=1 Tax=Kineosporia sp. NBRC 101731 TaxID=3032199 RepID=UPI0024A243C4|nr:TNT domain-containing protein [Kineosporia sp. NBRC 101731]GLY29397.1 hypothetical protein Kisp02_27620 [Kineosporia sp. NBRC 101731]
MHSSTAFFVRLRGFAPALATAVLAVGTVVAPVAPAQASSVVAPVAAGRELSTTCSVEYAEGDRRLGPATLPNSGTVGFELKGYRRTGELSAQAFLAEYYDASVGTWIYPPQNGYQLGSDGAPEVWRKTLKVGRELDRFGSEYGAFLSPAGTPYAERAIPPSNLAGTPAAGCNYRRYRVLKSFEVAAGPIAAWFEQRGEGWQYQLSGAYVPGAPASLNVLWLVDNGYLERV